MAKLSRVYTPPRHGSVVARQLLPFLGGDYKAGSNRSGQHLITPTGPEEVRWVGLVAASADHGRPGVRELSL